MLLMSKYAMMHRRRARGEVEIPSGVGTPIGGMTSGGGVAAAFDGDTAQTTTTGAYTGPSAAESVMWVGKTFSPGKVFSRAIAHSLTVGFQSGANPTIVLGIYGKNGSAPANATDGTLISDQPSFTDLNASMSQELVSIDLVTAWDHIWLRVDPSANANAGVSELLLWEWA